MESFKLRTAIDKLQKLVEGPDVIPDERMDAIIQALEAISDHIENSERAETSQSGF
jgi:hypothetical protein